MIAKIMHYIWLGSELPDWAQFNIDSFKRYHPNFEIVLHQDAELLDERYKELYDNTERWCSRADLLRFSILRQLGGYYCDTDILFFDAIPPLKDEGKIAYHSWTNIGDIALLACSAGLPAWDLLAERILHVHRGCKTELDYASGSKAFDRMTRLHPEQFQLLPGKYSGTRAVDFYTYCSEHGYKITVENPTIDRNLTAIHFGMGSTDGRDGTLEKRITAHEQYLQFRSSAFPTTAL